ncbi:MAG TPA: aquaporin [Acidobacteriota bacterium]|nr:aquaporin [Acidobacteriota bacterium]
MWNTLRRRLPEYLMEACGLGSFMISAGFFAILLEHPLSPLNGLVPEAALRRVLMGAAMGLTAVAIIYSPWGKRSGAHINPAVTLTFLRLGKIAPRDALGYVAAQFAGGLAGLALLGALAGPLLATPQVNFVATVPRAGQSLEAFLAETVMSATLMTVVLHLSNRPALNRFTGLAAGVLVASFIFLAGPLSGMSINPARSVASALLSGTWTAFWIYLTAPLLGMLAAAEIYQRLQARNRPVLCAKLHHETPYNCIFRCRYKDAAGHECVAEQEQGGPLQTCEQTSI